MNIYQTISRNDLLSYLDSFISENERVFEEKNHKLFGLRNRVKAHLLNQVNSRHSIYTTYIPILNCSHNFERYVLRKESIK